MLKHTLPVLMAGGSGSRLWPLSRRYHPKQFLPLLNTESLLENTLVRLPANLPEPLIICHESQRFMAAETVRKQKQNFSIILESESKNTAATAALAAFYAQSQHYEQIAIFPADHYLGDEKVLGEDLHKAAVAAGQHYLATFGIRPSHADSGFGYIQSGEALKNDASVFHIQQFIEKPSPETAEALVAAGDYYWNSGMFIFPTALFLQELKAYAPKIFQACQNAWEQRQENPDFIRPDAGHFGQCPSTSIDYAVMEKSQQGIVVPVTWQWSDIGSWSALFQLGKKDAENNVCFGDVVTLSCKNNYLRSEHRLLATFGIENLIVIETADATLVLPQEHSQHLKQLLETLKGRPELDYPQRVVRPWGSFECIDGGQRFQVKRLTLHPGAQISLQKHHHRSEHWVVVSGTAEITCDEKVFILSENQSTYIPLGSIHRLRNPGKIPLEIIEVQSGSYLGEDDIIRFEDTYGRVSL